MEKEKRKWITPQEVMKLYHEKLKRRRLQERLNLNKTLPDITDNPPASQPVKRRNPFLKEDTNNKKAKLESSSQLSNDDSNSSIFNLLHNSSSRKENLSFTNVIIPNIEPEAKSGPKVEVVKGENWMPVDWTLRTKVRFLSTSKFAWSQKIKISEEASALTGFSRCLNTNTTNTSLDTSSNAKFHQCCMYWQQPCLPWLSLFPRRSGKVSDTNTGFATNKSIKDSLHLAYMDALKSLFQLLRTRQCPFFYVCTNNFTVLFRSAGIGGFNEINAMVTPTTRGFRQVLKQEDIEFATPLKKRLSDQGYETLDSNQSNAEEEDEATQEEWLKDLGVSAEDIKSINIKQEKIRRKAESEIDNTGESLLLIEGHEVTAFFNFLMNCKSVTPTVGPLAGVPPTLLSPVAFNGASLNSLRVRENKVHIDNINFNSIELTGPIMPHFMHNLFNLCEPDISVTASFSDLKETQHFNKVKCKTDEGKENADDVRGSFIFKKENLLDCGLSSKVLDSFCCEIPERVTNYECLKYCGKLKLYNWL